MASYNRIILVGNLTRDPELSYTPANTAMCKFGIATNRKWRDPEGNTREDVCFLDCTVFGRRAETFNQYMTKGQSALVEGRVELSQWTTPEGEKRSKHRVVVDNFTFLGGRRDDGVQRSVPAGAGGVPADPGASGAGGGYDASPPVPPADDLPF